MLLLFFKPPFSFLHTLKVSLLKSRQANSRAGLGESAVEGVQTVGARLEYFTFWLLDIWVAFWRARIDLLRLTFLVEQTENIFVGEKSPIQKLKWEVVAFFFYYYYIYFILKVALQRNKNLCRANAHLVLALWSPLCGSIRGVFEAAWSVAALYFYLCSALEWRRTKLPNGWIKKKKKLNLFTSHIRCLNAVASSSKTNLNLQPLPALLLICH